MAYTFKHGDRPLEDYTVQRGVGRGGFGEVYYALSDGGREVALKYLRDNPDIELRGVSACMNLKSPHLVTVFDVKRSVEGEYFIVMEYVSGPSLRDLLLAEPAGLGSQKAAFFVREIAKGLGYLHDRGIVHRDLKPGNIFYEDGYVKIGDYGLSKFISVSRHSAQTTSVGTVHYMAPEVGSGNYSRGVDIYALGVMLYEMLLGRVPFEGASMGEVLMKHLTEQPEVEELPHPFGQIIRRSLAKDPNDRYQTVDEMVEEIFGVEDVKQSLAGFNPTSLSGVARRAVGDIADSPVPSPNPQRPAVGHFAGPPYAGPAAPVPPAAGPGAYDPGMLGQRLTERMERIGRKLDKKLGKLDAKAGRPQQVRPRRAGVAGPPGPGGAPWAIGPSAQPLAKGERAHRIILAGIMALGIATGIGLLVGVSAHDPLYRGFLAGLSSFLTVAGLSAGVLLAHWLVSPKLPLSYPQWASRVTLMGCCLPAMALGSIPVIAEWGGQGVAMLTAVLVATLGTRWDERLRTGAQGDLCVKSAFKVGIIAGILAWFFQAHELALMAGGVAAAGSLSVQALGWAFPSLALMTAVSPTPPRVGTGAEAAPPSPPPVAPAPAPGVGDQRAPTDIPMAIPVEQGVRGALKASKVPLSPLRSTFARGFWSLIAFILAGGTIALFVLPLVMELEVPVWGAKSMKSRPDFEAYMGIITGCVACFSFLIFALRKTTERKRVGFWRETLRPFLTAVAMTGMGAAITALAMGDHLLVGDANWAGAIVGLVISSLLFVVLLFARGRREARPCLIAGEVPLAPAGGTEATPAVADVPPTAEPVEQRVREAPKASAAPGRPLRSNFARRFWGVAAFLLAGGMIALFVLSLVLELKVPVEWGWELTIGKGSGDVYQRYVVAGWGPDYDAYMGLIMGCAACFSFAIFALRKTTRRKRIGFWRETLRPLLMAVAMTGMGLAITALATPQILQCDDDRAGVIVGLVFSSLLFVVVLFARGRRDRPAFVVANGVQPVHTHGVGGQPGVADEQAPAGVAETTPDEGPNRGEPDAG